MAPFVASFDAHSAHPYRNYAIPDGQARPDVGQVQALIAVFTTRGRTPRLEYLPGLCPAVAPALVATGFTTERHLPVMACAQGEVLDVATPPGIDLLLARTEDQLRVAAEVQNEAYGVDTTEDVDVARLRSVVASGGLVALAWDATSGEPAGSGLLTTPHEGVSELAAVGVREPFRRRGIAAALTVLLTRHGPSVGITTPFLTPEGDAELQYPAGLVGFVHQQLGLPIASMAPMAPISDGFTKRDGAAASDPWPGGGCIAARGEDHTATDRREPVRPGDRRRLDAPGAAGGGWGWASADSRLLADLAGSAAADPSR
ncbi:MAG: GNAT family N-acetyltransferase [Pseudonocardiaceae bacterium]